MEMAVVGEQASITVPTSFEEDAVYDLRPRGGTDVAVNVEAVDQ
jgi:hypothetical protein